MEKSLKDISWNVTESQYREDPALSYSMLASYERGGFNAVAHLKDKIETPSLTFGSATDAIITGGMDEFNANFVVMEFPKISDTLISIVRDIFREFSETHASLVDIPDIEVSMRAKALDFWANDKWDRVRAKKIKEDDGCKEYYRLLFIAGKRTILSTETYSQVMQAVRALKESPATKKFFMQDNPFDSIERCYQLKFKATFEGINYRCMADCIVVDHKNKNIILTDLKTSSHNEWDFHLSFRDWMYMIQARLYYRIIKANLEKDEYFKDFKVSNYLFIVVNKNTLTPMVWEYPDTKALGPLTYGMNQQIICRDPFKIGEELNYYLTTGADVPIGIDKNKPNDLRKFLNTI